MDGLEKRRDAQRRPGSFRNTLEGIRRLSDAGISVSIMGTLTPLNIAEFWALIDLGFYHTPARSFSFDFVPRSATQKE